MKKLFFYFLLTILFSVLVSGIGQEQNLIAKVIVNSLPGTLSVSPDNLMVNAPPSSIVENNLIFSQISGGGNINVSLFLEISPVKDWISFSETDFIVNPNKTKDIIAFIDIPNVPIGTYSGNIHAIADNQDLIIPIDVTISDSYKIKVKIDALERKVKPGNDVSVSTKLTKSELKKSETDVEGKITVNLEYIIYQQIRSKSNNENGKNKDDDGDEDDGDDEEKIVNSNVKNEKIIITTLTTTMDVINKAEKIVSIPIPSNANKGKYTVEVTATHLDKIAHDKDNFKVTTNWSKRFKKFLKKFRFR